MTSATDELRRLLDERGVEWQDNSDESVLHTTWGDMNCWFNEFPDGWTAWGMAKRGTPSQAIAATLGGGKLTAEQVRGAIEANSWAETSTIREFNDSSWQAIADELNAAMGGGECEMVRVSNTQDTRKCSACGKLTRFDYPLDRDQLNYCPKCGAKVRKAVKR